MNRRTTSLLALAVAAAASVATSWAHVPDDRFPCDDEAAWDPNAPLFLSFGWQDGVPVDSANFRAGLRLETAEGYEVPFVVADAGGGLVNLCPVGGLLPDTRYTWVVGPFDNDVPNHAAVPAFEPTGRRGFRTAAESAFAPITTRRACAAFSIDDVDPAQTFDACGDPWTFDGDGDGWPAVDDCDDDDPTVSPEAAEACNGIDDDCDGDVDENVSPTWYVDADGDNWGTGEGERSCEAPPGTTQQRGDCDDTDPDVHPYAPERCNGVDDDCDEAIDDEAGEPWYLDADGDGWGAGEPTLACEQPTDHVEQDGDCDDDDPSVNPGATELPADGIDSDCDGSDAPAP